MPRGLIWAFPSWMGSQEDLWGRWSLECPCPQAAWTQWPTGEPAVQSVCCQARPMQSPPSPGSTKSFLFAGQGWAFSHGEMGELSSAESSNNISFSRGEGSHTFSLPPALKAQGAGSPSVPTEAVLLRRPVEDKDKVRGGEGSSQEPPWNGAIHFRAMQGSAK